MLEQDKRIKLGGSLWMTVGGESLGGSGRVQLLALVGEQGSITHAAKAMKMSYKAAWDAIDTMNNLAGEPLVERVAGGKGGGGTRLTPRGQQLVENFRRIEAEHQRFIAQLGQQAQGIADDYLLIRNISMKTSARNHFAGTVTRVVHGAVNDEVEIAVRPGLHIVATVTHESAEGLGLACLSEWVVADLLKSGRLMRVPTTLPRMRRSCHLVLHRHKQMTGALERLTASLMQNGS